MMYRLYLTFDYNQDLAMFKKETQIFRSVKLKKMHKQSTVDFFIHLFNVWSYFTNKKFLNPHIKVNFWWPLFYSILAKIKKDNFTIIKKLSKFFQPDLIFYMRFEENLGHTASFLKENLCMPHNQNWGFSKNSLQKFLF